MRVFCVVVCTLVPLAALDLTYAAIVSSGQVSDVQYYQDYQKVTAISTTTDVNQAQTPPNSQSPTASRPVILRAVNERHQVPIRPVNNTNYQSLPTQTSQINDLVVFATDVQLIGASEELQQKLGKVLQTRTGGETSQSQIQQDVAALLDTGLLAAARAESRSNAAGLSVVYQVEPVVVRSLQLSGAKALTLAVALDCFQPQLGNPISLAALNQGVDKINEWYAQQGYVLARVLSVQTSPEGVVTLAVAEGVVDQIKFRFVKESTDEHVLQRGRTQEQFLRRELKLKPGDLFREDLVQQDLQQLYKLGLFQNVNLSLEGNARAVDIVYNLTELPAQAVNLGGGYSNDTGIFGTVSYKDQNVGGVSQYFGADVKVSFRDLQFETNFTSPYRASNPGRFGYQVSAFRHRGTSQTFNEGIDLPNDDDPREGQFGGRITLQRPIDQWQASFGLNYTRTSIRDRDGDVSPVDELGNSLSFSGTGIDDLTTVSFAAIKDQRDHPAYPTQGSVLRLSTEQSLPIGRGNILMNRLQANYSKYFPVQLLSTKEPEVLAINIQGGTTIGDLPPYEAFNLGGVNSVRGYGLGAVGSGRSYVLTSAEYRFPIFKILGGVVFADFASDLGSGDTILGEPAVVRGKPGSGFGFGAGVRVDSPIGLIRADLGINERGESRLQLGFGQRF